MANSNFINNVVDSNDFDEFALVNKFPSVFIVKKEYLEGMQEFSKLLANEGILRVVFSESQLTLAKEVSEILQGSKQYECQIVRKTKRN